jgi:hypothetical protein
MMLSESHKRLTTKQDLRYIFYTFMGLLLNLFPILILNKHIKISEELQVQGKYLFIVYLIVAFLLALTLFLRLSLFRGFAKNKFLDKYIPPEKIPKTWKQFNFVELKLATLADWVSLRISICLFVNSLVTVAGVVLAIQTHSHRYTIFLVAIIFILNFSLILLPRQIRKQFEETLLQRHSLSGGGPL